MSLDINQFNITHNLVPMWKAANCGLYEALYNSDGKLAEEIERPLREGLLWLVMNPTEAKKHDSSSGWLRLYENALPWLAEVYEYFRNHPKERIEICK